jgi:hypothetical protein
MPNDKNLQVYFLSDPFTEEVFYVGIGQPGRSKAHVGYVKTALRKDSTSIFHHPRHAKIAELLKVGHEPLISIAHDGLSKNEARASEVAYIAYYGRADLGTGPLLNRTKGGEWISDCPRTEEWLKNMASSARVAQNRPEVKALKSAKLKGQKRTAEQVENNRQGQLKIRDKISKDRMGGGNPNAKSCTINGVLYGSKTEAARALGLKPWTLVRKYL